MGEGLVCDRIRRGYFQAGGDEAEARGARFAEEVVCETGVNVGGR